MSDLIDRRVAIKAIENLQDCYNGFSDTYDKACIIGVLEEVPPAEPKTCAYWDRESNFCALHRPFAQPTVEAEPVRYGKWIREPNCWYRCSKCGSHYPSIVDNMDYHYCPNCGAKMDEEKENGKID